MKPYLSSDFARSSLNLIPTDVVHTALYPLKRFAISHQTSCDPVYSSHRKGRIFRSAACMFVIFIINQIVS